MFLLKAIILCGGFGRRLLPLTYRIPKVMVPVGGKPMLQHLVETCRNAGVEEIILSLNSGQKSVQEFFGDGLKFGLPIKYVFEEAGKDEEKLGAVGAIKHVLDSTGVPAECLILGGDNFFYGVDLKQLSRGHAERGAFATLALYRLGDRRDAEQYGVVQVDSRGRVMTMQEKPRPGEEVSDMASTALYHVGEAFLKEYLPKYVEELKGREKKPDRLGDLWARFVKDAPIYGHAFQGFWGDANSPKTYVETNKQAMRFLQGSVAQGLACSITDGHCVAVSAKAQVHEDALVKGPCIIEEGCVVGRGAVVGMGAHLMKGTFVGEGASVHGAIVFEKSFVGAGARLVECVVDAGARVGSGATVEPYAVLGFRSKVGEDSRILQESRLWPFVEVGEGAIVSGDVKLAEKMFLDKLDVF